MYQGKKDEFARIIKRSIINVTKCYRGKGPDYVNVKFNDDLIEITAKGILTNLGKLFIENGDIEFVKEIRNKSCHFIHDILIKDIYEQTGVTCNVVSEECQFQDDIRVLILKQDEALIKS